MEMYKLFLLQSLEKVARNVSVTALSSHSDYLFSHQIILFGESLSTNLSFFPDA
jgi:hypothetical protein